MAERFGPPIYQVRMERWRQTVARSRTLARVAVLFFPAYEDAERGVHQAVDAAEV